MWKIFTPDTLREQKNILLIRDWFRRHAMSLLVPGTLAAVLVFALRLSTPLARLMTDGAEYLNLANLGLVPQAHLGAPFVYRFAVPLFVHVLGLVTGAPPVSVFPVVAFAACIVLLTGAYRVALIVDPSPANALVVMLLLACSLFVVRFPLYCPYDVDVEACIVSFAAFACILRRAYPAALAVSLVGLIFKEFLLAPLAVLTGMFVLHSIRERSAREFRWALLTFGLTFCFFFLPRLLIPVSGGYGTSLHYKVDAPSRTLYLSELRMFLAWPPNPDILINVVLSLVSFWLPGLMLLTPGRIRALRADPGFEWITVILWTATVLLLMSIGGTKVMVFAIYTAPVLVLIVSLLLRMNVHAAEVSAVVIGTAVFNRIMFSFGSAGGDPGTDIAFYGAYRGLTEVTAWRFAEVIGWVLVAWVVRRLSRQSHPALIP
jgi:hypothetical protein